MNDLISRQEVLSVLEKIFNSYGMAFRKEYVGFAGEVPAAIDEIPTVYNKDKVIEQLKERLKLIREEQSADCIKHDGNHTPEQGMRSGMIRAILEDMEIVKKGGIIDGTK